MISAPKCYFTTSLLGVVFGFTLSQLGFSDFERIHAMFMFTEFGLILAFGLAVVVIAVSFRLWKTADEHPPRVLHKGTLPGGVLFGVGWALSGACPSIAWVQLGEGRLTALLTIAGIALGTWIYPAVHRRFFSWPTESCSG